MCGVAIGIAVAAHLPATITGIVAMGVICFAFCVACVLSVEARLRRGTSYDQLCNVLALNDKITICF